MSRKMIRSAAIVVVLAVAEQRVPETGPDSEDAPGRGILHKGSFGQALEHGVKITGCTVHYVDDKIDHGEIIAQREVRILPDDTPESLHARIQIAERELYPAVIAEFCERYRAVGL